VVLGLRVLLWRVGLWLLRLHLHLLRGFAAVEVFGCCHRFQRLVSSILYLWRFVV
jgi:hypothetical protein